MNISDKARNSVAFLGIKDKGLFRPKATCFFVAWIDHQQSFVHLVTAEHVVFQLCKQKYDIWLRVNLQNSKTALLRLDPQKFRYHPDNAVQARDVAVLPIDKIVVDDEEANSVGIDVSPIVLNGEEGLLPTPEFKQEYLSKSI